MRISAIGTYTFSGGTPSWLWQSQCLQAALTDNGTGDTSTALDDERGIDASEGVILLCANTALGGSDLVGYGAAHTSDNAKRITTVQEAAMGGASVARDIASHLALLELDTGPGLEVLAMGSVDAAGGAFAWHSGEVAAALTVGGGGDFSATLSKATDARESILLATPRGVLAAEGLICVGAEHTSDTVKHFTVVKEAAGGAASVLADEAFDFVVLGNRTTRPHERGARRLVAIGSVVSGVGPTFAVQSPLVSAIARSSAGDYDLTLARGYAADTCCVICSPRAAATASHVTSISVSHTSSTVKRITIGQEGAAGAASALTDVDFDFAVFAEV